MENFSFANPWFWAILGVVLLVLEVFTQVIIMIFFGLAALVVAIAAWQFGLTEFAYQILAFSVLGTLGLLAFRGRILANFRKGAPDYQPDQNQSVTLESAIAAGGEGRVQYQGTPWTAINETAVALPVGARASIVRIEGNKIFIKPAAR